MLKCKICGTEFPAIKERHYIARDNGKTGLSSAFGSNDEEKIYDSFDCPMCGCQVVVQDRKRKYSIGNTKNESQKRKDNGEE